MRKVVFVIFLLMSLAVTSIPISAQSTADSTFVAMYGIVAKWGGKSVWGRIWAFAEVPDKWAEVGLFWTDGVFRIASFPATYVFYAARLNITDKARLKYDGYAFYVSGTWNVYKITIEYDEHGNLIGKTIEIIVEKAFGELKVLSVEGIWTSFTVEIIGILPIAGIVRCYRVWTPPPYDIVRGDLNLDGKVNLFDLYCVAKAYKTKPGCGTSDLAQYDFNYDLNRDDAIDVYDLAIVAKDFGRPPYGTS